MEVINVPLVPQWNTISGCTSTPEGGFLYVGSKTVNYISKILENQAPTMKVFYTRQRVKCLDCDPEWSDTKYFVTLADDNSVQVWDYEEGKVVKGHKAHIKTISADGDGPPSENVVLCYLKNRTVLSIDSSVVILYSVASNTYSKTKRIIPLKHQISIVRGSPLNENIFAVGTSKGLILIADLKNETILYTMRGHDTEITSLAWWISPTLNVNGKSLEEEAELGQPKSSAKKSEPKKSPNPVNFATPAAGDDMFDIYDYDYLETEFGVPTKPAFTASDDDDGVNTPPKRTENAEDVCENSAFNYAEACQNLREDIMAIQDGLLNTSRGVPQSTLTRSQQVTLSDCQQPLRNHSDSSFSCNSYQSLDLSEKSDAGDSYEGDDDVKELKKELKTLVICKEKHGDNTSHIDIEADILLASGSHENLFWVWNTRTGGAIEKIQLKNNQTGGQQHGGNSQNSFVNVCWINEKLLVNNKSGELSLWSPVKRDDTKFTFEQEKIDFSGHRGVSNFCKIHNSEDVWTISSYREIVCENIESKKILATYSCASSNIASIRERPDDMNKIAFACADRRIGLLDISNMSATKIHIDNFSNKIDSAVLSLCWSPGDRYLAFGTADGRIGIMDTEKLTGVPVLMKPFCGKSIYSIDWIGKYIFVCAHDRVVAYEGNGKSKEAKIINEIAENASTIAVTQEYLFVGTQSGHLITYKREKPDNLMMEKICENYLGPKYISEIALCPLNSKRIAVCSLTNKIFIFSIQSDAVTVFNERVLEMNDQSSGNAWVKWSNKNENLLLSCGFDGGVRVWDLASPSKEYVFLKQYQCPMLCGLFCPIDENVVICAGKATSMEMFNIRREKSCEFKKIAWKNKKDKLLGNVQWASKLKCDLPIGTDRKKNRKNRKKQSENAIAALAADEQSSEAIYDKLEKLDLSGLKRPGYVLRNPTTIMHLTAIDLNAEPLKTVLYLLEKTLPTPSATYSDEKPARKCLIIKAFGTRDDAREVLNEELRNHQNSNTKSMAEYLIPQLCGNLMEHILERIQTKSLTEYHVSLAPTISYQFWKNCCSAYATQMLETNCILPAVPYLMAIHEVKDCIAQLLNRKYFKEAWIIAKIYREHDDPVFGRILEQWIQYLVTTGNLEGAALLSVLSGKNNEALNILKKRRDLTSEHELIIKLLEG